MKRNLTTVSMTLALATLAALAVAAENKTYDARCLKCHGANGDGNGKAADLLNPKPTDFTSADWQAKQTDANITDAITNGGKGTTLKISRKMPAFGGKLKKEEISALVTKVRSFGPKK